MSKIIKVAKVMEGSLEFGPDLASTILEEGLIKVRFQEDCIMDEGVCE